jgi:Kef-type K+ transport system membrane component KefB
MTSAEFVDMLTQLAVMLVAGVSLGFVMRKLKQPSVVGEMTAGVIIGVTVLGSLWPGAYDWLFDSGAVVTSTRSDLIKVGMLFFLYVAGSEVDLTDVKTLGKRSLIIGLVGTLGPIAAGIGLVYLTPVSMWGESMGVSRLAFAAFIGMNIANSANPVLARILIDLGMMKSRIATVMMTATVIDDLVNWTLYAIILGSVSTGADGGSDRGLALDLLLVAALFIGVLGVVRWLAPRMVGLARRHLAWPSGYVAVVAVTVLGISAVSEAIGVQAFLGAFLAGVAFSGVASGVGATGHKALAHVAVGYFAPLFFVSMALRTDFIESFDVVLVLTVIAVAVGSKLLSVVLGVRLAGLPAGREAWAMAWGLNARGATGIILAATGLQTGLIGEEVFVALVVMAIVTSILAGPLMVRALGPLRASMTTDDAEPDEPIERPVPGLATATRALEREMTEAELARASVVHRVVAVIDDPTTARPLVEVAAELAASQQPAEVVLMAFKEQTSVEDRAVSRLLDAVADDLVSLRELERLVQARGVLAVSVSQRSTDLGSDIVGRAREVGAQAVVVGDRRDDPRWIAIVDRLIADQPADVFVVVAPRPRAGTAQRTGPPVVEAAPGLAGVASLEAAVRFALGGPGAPAAPIVVGLAAKAKHAGPYRDTLARLADTGRSVRILESGLHSIEGAAATEDASFVVRPFTAPEGLAPVERARPDAERFGCPVVLVAPDPGRPERSSLVTLLDSVPAPDPAR